MKQAQNARKQRGRSAPRKGSKNTGGGNRSNEPKVRGNPKQLLEKYKTQAREAKQAGDRVQAEYFYQFADHYQRILNEMNARNGGQQGRDESDDAQENSTDGDQERGKQRRGRGRRQRQPQENAENGPETVSDNEADPATSEQPVEVHPELDLGGTVASNSEEEKPKRRRAPVQRRRSPKPKAEGDTAAADAAPAASPEGNEAA
ncbi:MAG: DUF4167 domain-containing protein [Alphaproteobacteria bacterium]|nr:DUF4167 domain-containing protein [Alphaproteobacteria bacterium]